MECVMQLSKITSKKVIIPAVMLAGSVAIANLSNHNDISSEATLEYMDKNPISQGAKAGILTLFGLGGAKRKKETESSAIESQTNITCNDKNWEQIRMPLMSLATDLYYEKEETDIYIDKLIEKLDKESVDKELGEYAKRGLKFIKENSEDLIAVDVACNGHFEDGSENLYWSVFHAAKSALYPELVEEKQKNDLQKWIELGSTFMNNYS